MAASQSLAERPHRTLLALSIPVLGSLIAEPLTSLVDTAFVARLGVESLAALGVGTMLLSALFWAFSFLGVATQTRVASIHGDALSGPADRRCARLCLAAVTLALALGASVALAGAIFAPVAARAMGAEGEVAALATEYLRYRLLGAPAMLASFAVFGALRGVQDMHTPLWIAGGMNALNLVLDPLLIFGAAGAPALGVAGAALASSLSQWAGAVWAGVAATRRLGYPDAFDWHHARGLLAAGADLVVRAGALNAFLGFATRQATRIGAEAGAVHQVVRSAWFFNALFLDAFAIVGQSLVASHAGSGDRGAARRVARTVCQWSVGVGGALGLAMLAAEPWVRRLYLPVSAAALFATPWRIAAWSQPVSGLAFGTDGIHFGSGDFRYLRNAVLAALLLAGAALALIDLESSQALPFVWLATLLWAAARAVAGFLRVWPGIGAAPLGEGG